MIFADPPTIVTDLPTPTAVRITEAQPLTTFPFVVDSNPASTITWMKDGVLTTDPQSLSSENLVNPWYTVRQTSTPYSTVAARTMSGVYNATACNSLGCVQSAEATLIIECKSSFL